MEPPMISYETPTTNIIHAKKPDLRTLYEDALTRKLQEDGEQMVAAAELGRTIALGAKATGETIFFFNPNASELPHTD